MKLVIKIFFFLLVPSLSKAQQDPYVENWNDKQIDSLQNEWRHTSNDTIRMRISRSLGWHYQEINRDSSLYFHTEELTLARTLKLKIWEADAFDQCGWVLAQLKNYPRSLQYFLEGISILENKDCEKNIWQITNFSKDGKPATARLTALGFLYNDLSQLYAGTGNIGKEFSNLFQALQIGKSISNYTILSLVNMNLGGSYLKINNPDSSLIFEQEALNSMDKSGYKIYQGNALLTMGSAYLKKANYELAKQYLEKSVFINKEQNNKTGTAFSYISLADLYKALAKNDSSIYYTKKALSDFKQVGVPASVNDCYASLYDLYKSSGKADSAFYYLQLYKSLNDSLYKAEKEKIDQYQNVGFNEQIKKQQEENERIENENAVRTYILVAGIAVFMLIAFLLYRNNRNRRKANELLHQQKTEIEIQKKNVDHTLSELRSTQAQLIQSEKMASLGELTAGIAHEIQNPLNFVNNFSEVNTELIDEMQQEMDKGNYEDAKAISNDIKDNEQKINHHGKRADSIVKGMLQHSRSSTATKEPTDINALADEYLRLSYHGLRAKDKSFNATLKTDFDESIGNITVIPQDIGRVLLNLYNNAFYAVNEKQKAESLKLKAEGKEYEPTISVSTKRIGGNIEISVADNGNGIPQKIVDKIFQPFFTTKPTGQGTGLGLSLSYDIVKAHSGEFKVETKEGEGSAFIIQLPAN